MIVFVEFVPSNSINIKYCLLQLRVGAYDSSVPYDVSSTTCQISVLRNENEPIFLEEPYEVNLLESTTVGTSIYRVTAEDADGVSF